MTAFDIVELDPDDEGPLFAAALELDHVEYAELDPERDPHPPEAFRADHHSSDDFPIRHLLAIDSGEVVGRLNLYWWTVEGNLDKLDITLYVAPDHRRRGAARALLRAGLDAAAGLGRTSVMIWGPLNATTRAFFSSLGLEPKLTERESRMFLADTDPELMQRWVGQRAERAPGYELIHWRGSTPAEQLEPTAALMTAMNDAPMEGIDYADDTWTADDLRNLDHHRTCRGIEGWTSIVVSPDGSPAGLTTVLIPIHQPAFSYQGDTVVTDAHRNRGIGRWLKADMWQRLRADRPDVQALDTENAESNDPMLAINVAMGFRPLIENGGWQATIADLRPRVE